MKPQAMGRERPLGRSTFVQTIALTPLDMESAFFTLKESTPVLLLYEEG